MGNWRDAAACHGMTDFFFPHAKGGRPNNRGIREDAYATARLVCKDCPVREECLDYAVEHPDLVGFWGGSTPNQRRKLRERRRRKVLAS